MKVVCVVGTRPEAIKMAPVVTALRAVGPDLACRLVVTAQHREMLDQVLRCFGIVPDLDLDLMRPGQSLPDLTARVLVELDRTLAAERPDWVLAQGDTTTTFATALASYYRKVSFGHVEAGLRTGNKFYPYPEEMNRVLASSLADLHFAPTAEARDNLLREGVSRERVKVTGNTVIDALFQILATRPALPFQPEADRRMVLVTSHRRENFGAPLEEICQALQLLAGRGDVQIVYPVHCNPQVQQAVQRSLAGRERITLTPPLDYPQFVAAMNAAYLILTDSGGVQEEAPSLGKPVLVLRDETERPEAVAAGTVLLVGPHRDAIVAQSQRLLDDPAAYEAMSRRHNPYGDGQAAGRIVEALLAHP